MDNTEFQNGQTDENSSHDCGDCCSPFMLCSSCAGFTIENLVSTFIKPQKISAEINVRQPFIYTFPFLGGIWQPPEFA
ncbi:MAG: hypothetical protein LBB85_03470 [Dysgonamonadaceae bacterium]|jgi:hypothetical protein|nr:hypothetical protein [Dysgonamonadaceae bacterium]